VAVPRSRESKIASPRVKHTNQTVLAKVSNPNNTNGQTVWGDSGKRRLFGRKFRLDHLTVALVGHSFQSYVSR
jgi:hypothetical protein